MSEINDAANAVKSAANTFRALLKVGDVLDHIASLENAQREAVTKRDQAMKEAALALGDLSEAKADVLVAEAKAKSILDEATVQAVDIVAKAKGNAEDIHVKANAEHKRIITDAKLVKTGIDAEIKRADEELVSLNGQRAELQAQVEALKKELALLKAKFA